MTSTRRFLLSDDSPQALDDYASAGGGRGLERSREVGPDRTVDAVRESGLRGRGGAGFPTGVKWAGARSAEGTHKYVVCNAAEGEPGTFKDRWLIRNNPYQLLEGIAIAAFAVGAEEAFIGIKAKFGGEIERLEQAAGEMAEAALFDVPLTIVPGPDDYLFGEEKALLEVIEGNDPLPRLYPPYVQGLFEGTKGESRPTVVNNVETLSNIPHILANGSDWFRSFGTDTSPGTMVFSIGGDVRREAVAELEMGTPLSLLVYAIGGGMEAGRHPVLVANGVSNRPLRPVELETPLDFDALQAIGSGLGSGGFTVYDDTACVVQVAAALSDFLNEGSCGQCPPCKLGTGEIEERFRTLARGEGRALDIEELAAWSIRVTDANRCGLGAGQQALARGILDAFPEHLAEHIGGEPCPKERAVAAPVIEDWDPEAGRFRYGGKRSA